MKKSKKKKQSKEDVLENETLSGSSAKAENVSENADSDKASEDEKNKKTAEEKSAHEHLEEEPSEVSQEEKIREYNEKYLRLYSEFDNYRKRTIKEKNELSRYANAQLMTDLLPVIDDFERAMQSLEESEINVAVKEGINLIFNKLLNVLEKQGLKAIDTKDATFDTDFHEAVTKMPAENENMKGKIYDIIQKGYMMHDKVIRYAKVVVAE